MVMTNAEKQKLYRERKARGEIAPKWLHPPMTAVERMRKMRTEHPERERARRRERKIMVFTHYGNGECVCVICGESRLACLSIDHIGGKGNKARGDLRGTHYYARLIKDNFPGGLQTLCMNCQWVKRFENNEHR